MAAEQTQHTQHTQHTQPTHTRLDAKTRSYANVHAHLRLLPVGHTLTFTRKKRLPGAVTVHKAGDDVYMLATEPPLPVADTGYTHTDATEYVYQYVQAAR